MWTVKQKYHVVIAGLVERHMPMFEGVVKVLKKYRRDWTEKDIETYRSDIREMLNSYREIFKRRDQFSWAARLLRDAEYYSAWLEGYRRGEVSRSQFDQSYYTKRRADWSFLANKLSDFRHYLGNAEVNNIKSILNYRFPPNATAIEIYNKLNELEKEWLENQDTEERVLEPLENQKDFLKFKDGWKWVLIDAQTCEREGKAMRHCGNAAPNAGDKILSLREAKKDGKEKPHLTFILNGGVLGEMKGYGNQKPAAKYHKYIVPLLKDSRIESIRGGGYAPENNFALTDLPRHEWDQLYAEKPTLHFSVWAKRPENLKKVLKDLGVELVPEHPDYVLFQEFDNPGSFIHAYRLTPLEFSSKFQLFMEDLPDPTEQDLRKVLSIIEKRSRMVFAELLQKLRRRGLPADKAPIDAIMEALAAGRFRKLGRALDYLHRWGHDVGADITYASEYHAYLKNLESDILKVFLSPVNYSKSPVYLGVPLNKFLEEFDLTDSEVFKDLRNKQFKQFKPFVWSGKYEFDEHAVAEKASQILQEHGAMG